MNQLVFFYFLFWEKWKYYRFANLHAIQVFGLLTKPLLSLLIPPRTGLNTSSLLSSQSMLDPLLTSMMGSDFDVGQINSPQYNLQFILTAPARSVHRLWRKFDDRFMRPVFGGRGFVPFVPGSPVERSVPESHLGTVTEAERSWNEARGMPTIFCRSSDRYHSYSYFIFRIHWCELFFVVPCAYSFI
jgi:hypothetical protein